MSEKQKKPLTKQQQAILDNTKKDLIVSASAGSGKTFVVIEYLKQLLCEKHVPLSKMLVLTFTKAAAGEMKTRLTKAILSCSPTPFLTNQLDEIPLSDISTIHAFCEKLLKKYSNILEIPQNFIVLDDKNSWQLKNRAFNDAFEKLALQNEDNFNFFYLAFKKNKDLMIKTVEALSQYLESQEKGNTLAQTFLLEHEKYLAKSKSFLTLHIENELKACENEILNTKFGEMEEWYSTFAQNLLSLCKTPLEKDFIQNCKKIATFEFPQMPRKRTMFLSDKELLSRTKERLQSLAKFAKNFVSYDEYFAKEEKDNRIGKALVELYASQKEEYEKLKKYRNGFDFSDLERLTQVLLENQEVANDLQNKYSYIFVDEYQDTNPLQESFVKAIAKKGNFVAVGDPKQGIYGFRNASMEIMKKDIESFSGSPNADALYLNGNFRSDDNILQFVNAIFNKHMTLESVGIDYEGKNKLVGMTKFLNDGFKPVEVDVIMPKKEESSPVSGVYSVQKDNLDFNNDNQEEVLTIASHIEKYLSGRIYDSQSESYRNVTEGDIVVLFRKRSALMEQLSHYLQSQGYNVLSDLQSSLLEDGEIASILSFVKLALSKEDEVALASAMCSAIGGFSVQEIAMFKGTKDKTFKENVLDCQDKKVVSFFEIIEKFKRDINLFGLSQALENLLNEKHYYVYQKSLENSYERKINLDNLFKAIKGGDFDFNPKGLIDFIEEGQITSTREGQINAITLTTIHATKGLEYPIVILAGCGENMGKADTMLVNFSSEFGLGTNLYDFDRNLKLPSIPLVANKIAKVRKEYIDELMIFYVALTRAKNHLVLTGTITKDGMRKIYQNKNYLSLTMNAFGENFSSMLFQQEHIEKENVIFNIIDEVCQEENSQPKAQMNEQKINIDKIKDYIEFVYPNKNSGLKFKNSVTSIMQEDLDKRLVVASGSGENRDEAIETGNAYHEALKILPFEKINNIEDIDLLLKKDMLTDGYFEKIDKSLLLKNILQIKNVLNGQFAMKEKEFIMSATLKELGIASGKDKIIVQGIVDLFSLGEKNILIDYKYTSQKNSEKIKEKYLKQINLYERAIEKAFNKKLDEKFILSLKEAKLIEIK